MESKTAPLKPKDPALSRRSLLLVIGAILLVAYHIALEWAGKAIDRNFGVHTQEWWLEAAFALPVFVVLIAVAQVAWFLAYRRLVFSVPSIAIALGIIGPRTVAVWWRPVFEMFSAVP